MGGGKERTWQAQARRLMSNVKDREKEVEGLKRREQSFQREQAKEAAKIKNLEIKLASFKTEKGILNNQVRDSSRREQTWEMEKQDLLNQIQGHKGKLKEVWKMNDELQDRNKKLFDDNKSLKQKIGHYSRKLSNLAVLRDRLSKDNAVLHYNLGVFHTQRQSYDDAISEFEKVLEINPNDTATHYNLGVVYSEYLNDKPKAITHFRRYLMGAPPSDKDIERAKKYILTWEKWEEAE